MDNQQRCRWEVKDTVVSGWRTLAGELTPKEVWDMRMKGNFWLATPIHEDDLARNAFISTDC